MNAQDLKNSIFQLAIQGKLVEQREEEGAVKELLEQVKAEKEQLIKEGKIKKEKKLQEIKQDEIPFDIPDSWKWMRLGDVLEIARGGSPRPIKSFLTDSDDGINWIKIGDTDKGGKFINQTNEKIIKEGLKKSRYVRKGDFLLSNSMSFGRPYILNIDGCIHDGWLVLSQFIEIFNKEFLYYLLSSRMVFNQFSSRVSGAVVNNLNSDKVRITLVPTPPLAEQKRIVSKIEELMPYVEKYDKAYSEVEELNKKSPEDMQKSIVQYAIQGKLVEHREEEGTAKELYQQIQEKKKKLIKENKIKKTKALPDITEEKIPFDIPESWKWVRLGNVIHLTSGQDMTSSKYNDISNGIPYLTGASNIHDGEIIINRWTQEPKAIALKGDILLTCKGTVGKTVILGEEKVHIARQIMSIRTIEIDAKFMQYFIKSYVNILKAKAKSMIPGIERKDVLEAPLPLPPLEEQKRIVEKIEELLPYTKQLIK
ncbi:restriction endonuclease subunit S [Virgibacillus salarius]|uniref:restriction endonuclease subunit S n=1 Tax=Virgibacillus salarius TaxID=447199 RepID=UPI0031E1FBC0